MLMKTAAISGFVLLLGAGVADAAPAHCPPGLAKKGACGHVERRAPAHSHDRAHDRDHDRDHDRAHHRAHHRAHDRDHRRDRDRDHARRGDRDHDRDHRHWRRGDHVDRDRYVVIDRWESRGYAPPPRGHAYVRIDGEVLLIAIAGGIVADIIAAQ